MSSSSRASRVCVSVLDHLPSTTTHKHKLLKEIPKFSNQLVLDRQRNEKKLTSEKRRNVSLQERDTTLYHNPLLSKELRSYRYKIQNCDSIDEIYNIFSQLSYISNSKTSSSTDLSVLFDDFMKQFIKLQKHTECLNVLQLMYNQHIPRSLASYNIIFDGYVSYGHSHTAMKIYYQYMLKNDVALHPNIITVNTLLCGCKQKADIYLIKQIWTDIVIPFQITPNIATYILLITIYGRAGLPDHCYALFANMIVKEGLRANTGICGALMNAYAMKGDVKRCYQILKYMETNGIKITIIEYCTLMKCYLWNEQPLIALNVYHKYLLKLINESVGDKTIKIMASMRMTCYSKLIQGILGKHYNNNKDKIKHLEEADIENVKYYFKMIVQQIPFDVKLQCKIKNDANNFYDYLDDNLLQRMLNTLIIMNENECFLNENYENEMLTFLENGLKNNKFAFWNSKKKNMIDFHNFWSKNCVLILRYFLSFERKYIQNALNYEIKIIVGSGSHSDKNIRKDKHKNDIQSIPISQAILEEVLHWNPAVKMYKLENEAVLALDSTDLKHFLHQNANKSPWFKHRAPK